MQSYLTIKEQSVYENTVKRSKFIGCSFIVPDGQTVAAKLKEVKTAYGGATHYCYAYNLSPDSSKTKFSDDGEPSKTAGFPILQAINAAALYNTMVVVVRYFGGVKLGTGGLARAYFDTANGVLDLSGVNKYIYSVLFDIVCDYAYADAISNITEKYGQVTDRQFDKEVKIYAACPQKDFKNFEQAVMQASGGNAKIFITDKNYFHFNIN